MYKYIADNMEMIDINDLWLIDCNGEQWNYYNCCSKSLKELVEYINTYDKSLYAFLRLGNHYINIDKNVSDKYYKQVIELNNGLSIVAINHALISNIITADYAKCKLLSIYKQHFKERDVDIAESLAKIIESTYINYYVIGGLIVSCVELIESDKKKYY